MQVLFHEVFGKSTPVSLSFTYGGELELFSQNLY